MSAISTLAGAVVFLYRMARQSESAEQRCREQLAEQSTRIAYLEGALEQSRAGLLVETEAVIVVDAQGRTIEEWSPGATVLFHWPQREMLGKTLERLIPIRLRGAFEAEWNDVSGGKRAPNRGPHELTVTTREGVEIYVSMLLSSWVIGDRLKIGATIHPRGPAPQLGPSAAAEGNSNATPHPGR